MKTTFQTILFLLLSITIGFADTEITKEEAQTLAGVDLDKLGERGPQLYGKLVRLKFNYRSKEVIKGPAGELNGTLYLARSVGAKWLTGRLDVRVPADGAEWFMRIPTDSSRAILLVIARVGDGPMTQTKLIGREVKTDLRGSRVVW